MTLPDKRVTLQQVAERAGVGTMTVSRALRQPDKVSPQLRERIMAAVRELGYLPDKAAGALAGHRSDLVVMIVPSATDAVVNLWVELMHRKLEQAGLQLMLGYSDYSDLGEERQLARLLPYRPMAVILTSSKHSSSSLRYLSQSGAAVVEVCEAGVHSEFARLYVDASHASYQLTKSLLYRGYRHVAFCVAKPDYSVFSARVDGWRKAMRDHMLTPSMLLAIDKVPDVSLGAFAVGEALARWPDLDAFICSHDALAQGALAECQRRDITVPGRMAIAGFGDLPSSSITHPPLSSVAEPYEPLAERLVQWLKQVRQLPLSVAVPQLSAAFDFRITARRST